MQNRAMETREGNSADDASIIGVSVATAVAGLNPPDVHALRFQDVNARVQPSQRAHARLLADFVSVTTLTLICCTRAGDWLALLSLGGFPILEELTLFHTDAKLDALVDALEGRAGRGLPRVSLRLTRDIAGDMHTPVIIRIQTESGLSSGRRTNGAHFMPSNASTPDPTPPSTQGGGSSPPASQGGERTFARLMELLGEHSAEIHWTACRDEDPEVCTCRLGAVPMDE